MEDGDRGLGRRCGLCGGVLDEYTILEGRRVCGVCAERLFRKTGWL